MSRMRTSAKLDPRIWEASKRQACEEAGLCDHSARKMQWAVRRYKQSGGRYKGRKDPRNSLARWTKQRWRTSDGRPSRGNKRYLPDAAWRLLTVSQQKRTDKAKRQGTRRGMQYVPQPRDVVATLAQSPSLRR